MNAPAQMITSWRRSAIRRRSVIAAQKVDLEVEEPAGFDTGADVVNQTDDEPLVMDRAQRRGQHLPGLEQVMQVRLGVSRAGVAIAVFLNRGEVTTGGRSVDIESSADGVDSGIACDARGRDAVEDIDTILDRREDVVWL